MKTRNKKVLQPTTFSSFTNRAPQITPGDPLRLVAPEEVVTIAGAFFGDKKGAVYLADTSGHTEQAKVRDWSMDSISFEIPEGLTGYLTLGVSNEAGSDIQRFWGTLTPLPPGATAQVDKGVTTHTRNNASGVYFNGQFWVFYLVKDDTVLHDHNAIQVNYYSYTNNAFVSAPQCGGHTWAQVVPLVIAHELWVFHTGENGGLYYKRFHTSSNMWENGTGDWNRIGTLTTDNSLEIAPAYDPTRNLIMVYYWYNNTICEVGSFDRGTNWLGGGPVVGLTNRVVSAPSAVFYQQTATNGLTLLAAGVEAHHEGLLYDTDPAVFWVRDGVVIKSDLLWWGLTGRPFLADLGEDYIALTWFWHGKEGMDQYGIEGWSVYWQKLNKHTGAWLPTYDVIGQVSDFAPNLAVNYEQKPDSRSLGYRWDAVLYLFWGKQIWTSFWSHYDNAEMSSIEPLGTWREIADSPQVTNLGSDMTNFFQLWSVIGVVDAPPFILNGQDIGADDTCVKFGASGENTAKAEMSLKMGPYLETGGKSPLTLELSEWVSQTMGNEQKTTVSFEDRLNASLGSDIRVYYLVPELEVHKVQWNNPNPTTNFMYPTRMTSNTSARSLAFNPLQTSWSGFAGMQAFYFNYTNCIDFHQRTRDRDRLMSYGTPVYPSYPYWFAKTQYWSAAEGPSFVCWVSSDTTNRSPSATVKLKIGADIKGYLGFDVEGSFEVRTETATIMTTGSMLILDNPKPGPLTSDPIQHFTVDARWVAPSASGPWVPWNRQGCGDQPWFITYGVVRNSIW